MTSCTVAKLGLGYESVLERKDIELEVMSQQGKNPILRDAATGDAIQHIFSYRDHDGKNGSAMNSSPTFRKVFHGFAKAYPAGRVLINKPASNIIPGLIDIAT